MPTESAEYLEDAEVCGIFEKAIHEGKMTVACIDQIPLPGGGNKLYFYIKILSSLHQTPCEYLNSKGILCSLFDSKVLVDGETWDCYTGICPKPPCHFLTVLLGLAV
jgi:hypothetical protein